MSKDDLSLKNNSKASSISPQELNHAVEATEFIFNGLADQIQHTAETNPNLATTFSIVTARLQSEMEEAKRILATSELSLEHKIKHWKSLRDSIRSIQKVLGLPSTEKPIANNESKVVVNELISSVSSATASFIELEEQLTASLGNSEVVTVFSNKVLARLGERMAEARTAFQSQELTSKQKLDHWEQIKSQTQNIRELLKQTGLSRILKPVVKNPIEENFNYSETPWSDHIKKELKQLSARLIVDKESALLQAGTFLQSLEEQGLSPKGISILTGLWIEDISTLSEMMNTLGTLVAVANNKLDRLERFLSTIKESNKTLSFPVAKNVIFDIVELVKKAEATEALKKKKITTPSIRIVVPSSSSKKSDTTETSTKKKITTPSIRFTVPETQVEPRLVARTSVEQAPANPTPVDPALTLATIAETTATTEITDKESISKTPAHSLESVDFSAKVKITVDGKEIRTFSEYMEAQKQLRRKNKDELISARETYLLEKEANKDSVQQVAPKKAPKKLAPIPTITTPDTPELPAETTSTEKVSREKQPFEPKFLREETQQDGSRYRLDLIETGIIKRKLIEKPEEPKQTRLTAPRPRDISSGEITTKTVVAPAIPKLRQAVPPRHELKTKTGGATPRKKMLSAAMLTLNTTRLLEATGLEFTTENEVILLSIDKLFRSGINKQALSKILTLIPRESYSNLTELSTLLSILAKFANESESKLEALANNIKENQSKYSLELIIQLATLVLELKLFGDGEKVQLQGSSTAFRVSDELKNTPSLKDLLVKLYEDGIIENI